MTVHKVCITGGEQSGKSAVVRAIANIFQRRVLPVPEMSTFYLNSGFPRPGVDIAWSPELQAILQQGIFSSQVVFEQAFCMVAAERGFKILVTDRGKPDGIAYRPEENVDAAVASFCQENGTSLQEMYGDYLVVVHLETIAAFKPEDFETMGETFRVIPVADQAEQHRLAVEKALRLERRLRGIWEKHPWYCPLEASLGVQGKINAVAGMIELLLGKRDLWQ